MSAETSVTLRSRCRGECPITQLHRVAFEYLDGGLGDADPPELVVIGHTGVE